MEWVEVQGKTVDIAVDVAMSELGVDSRDDVEVTVIQEPTAGFLGMGAKEAHVRVTKVPRKRRRSRGRGRGRGSNGSGSQGSQGSSQKGGTAKGSEAKGGTARGSKGGGKPSGEGRNRTKSEGKGGNGRQGDSGQKRQEKKVSEHKDDKKGQDRDDRPEQAPIEEQAEVAEAFVSGLLGAFGLEGTVTTRVEDEILYIDVSGEQTEALIGPKGSVMHSVLELTRTVVQRKTYGAPRMRIDIGGYVERRREALRIYAGKIAEQVIEDTGEIMMEPMNAADRKVLHDAVADIDGVRSFSEGEDPRRAVVIAYDGTD